MPGSRQLLTCANHYCLCATRNPSKINVLCQRVTRRLATLCHAGLPYTPPCPSSHIRRPTELRRYYGMNFDFMPELRWPFGYPTALGFMVISAILLDLPPHHRATSPPSLATSSESRLTQPTQGLLQQPRSFSGHPRAMRLARGPLRTPPKRSEFWRGFLVLVATWPLRDRSGPALDHRRRLRIVQQLLRRAG